MANKAEISLENTPCAVVILAAGKGTRMKSKLPKVLHPVAGRAMLGHVMAEAEKLAPTHLCVVTAKDMEEVRGAAKVFLPKAELLVQDPTKEGTGAATLAAREVLENFTGDVLVLFGDTPLITAQTLHKMREALHRDSNPVMAVLGMEPKDPAEYGRLVLNSRQELEEIVEFKDASPIQRDIRLCNSGVMAFKGEWLFKLLDRIQNKNAKHEYYLTDAVKIAREMGQSVAVALAHESEVQGVNSRAQLADAEKVMQTRLRHHWMSEGVTLHDPETVYFHYDTQLAADVTVHPNVFFGPKVKVAGGVEIRSFCHFEGVSVGAGAVVGPFARLRPGAVLGAKTHIGNFVEIKKAVLGDGVKVNHLSYIGDAEIGDGTNIGAGTITCNYDGFTKSETRIGKGAFIGSNTALVAPVTIGDEAIIGAGSVITDDVPPHALSFTRPTQVIKELWAKTFRAKKKAEKA